MTDLYQEATEETEVEAVFSLCRNALEGIPFSGMAAKDGHRDLEEDEPVLIGFVEDAAMALRACDTIKRVPGIQKLDNRLVSAHQLSFD